MMERVPKYRVTKYNAGGAVSGACCQAVQQFAKDAADAEDVDGVVAAPTGTTGTKVELGRSAAARRVRSKRALR